MSPWIWTFLASDTGQSTWARSFPLTLLFCLVKIPEKLFSHFSPGDFKVDYSLGIVINSSSGSQSTYRERRWLWGNEAGLKELQVLDNVAWLWLLKASFETYPSICLQGKVGLFRRLDSPTRQFQGIFWRTQGNTSVTPINQLTSSSLRHHQIKRIYIN